MNSRKFIASLVCCALVSLFALGICSLQGVAGQLVSGVYRVMDTTDLGPQIRVTMHIRLINAGNDRIFVTQVRLREFLPHGKATDKPVGVILEPHANSEFTQQFTVAKQEYDMWSKGAQPHLGLRMQVAGAAETTMTIPLTLLSGSR
jgi:hypothetical protein